MFLVIALVAGAFYYLYQLGGPGVAVIGIFVLGTGAAYLADWISEMRKIRRYGDRYENIYVVENPPGVEMKDELPQVQHLLITVPKGKVLETVMEEKEMLNKAGNRRNVEVIPIHFQSGIHVNETFEQYADRAWEMIKADRSARHEKIKEKDPEWYLRNHHGEGERATVNYEWNGKVNKNV